MIESMPVDEDRWTYGDCWNWKADFWAALVVDMSCAHVRQLWDPRMDDERDPNVRAAMRQGHEVLKDIVTADFGPRHGLNRSLSVNVVNPMTRHALNGRGKMRSRVRLSRRLDPLRQVHG